MSRFLKYSTMFLLVFAMSAPAFGDSLFNRRVSESGTLVSDMKMRFRAGDLITVLVRETIDARTSSELETEKESELRASTPGDSNQTFTGSNGFDLVNADKLPNWDLQVESEFEADGTTRRRNSLVMTVSCEITRVHANGNIEISGKKRVTVNREDSLIVVSGVARSRDVSADNTIDSAQLANGIVELTGHGPLWNNQRRGFFTKLLDWISPF